jgi:hypothetical protein
MASTSPSDRRRAASTTKWSTLTTKAFYSQNSVGYGKPSPTASASPAGPTTSPRPPAQWVGSHPGPARLVQWAKLGCTESLRSNAKRIRNVTRTVISSRLCGYIISMRSTNCLSRLSHWHPADILLNRALPSSEGRSRTYKCNFLHDQCLFRDIINGRFDIPSLPCEMLLLSWHYWYYDIGS